MNETQFVEGWQAKHLYNGLCVNERHNRVNDDQLELFHLQYNRFKFEQGGGRDRLIEVPSIPRKERVA